MSSSSASSSSGGTTPGCERTDSTFVSEMCGVFVAAAGKPGAAGTMTDPLPTLDEGIKAAVTAGKYVFACADTFDEQVTITTGLAIYGGRDDCLTSWTVKAGGATTINGPTDKIALTITTPGHVVLENVNAVAPLGTEKSKSSIAVLVTEADAEFTGCTFTAKDGFVGDVGAMIPYDAALDGLLGSPGRSVCDPGSHPGGVAVVKTCGAEKSTGGIGGNGGPPAGITAGNGGDGALTSGGTSTHGNGETAIAVCSAGAPGAPGGNGTDGAGAIGIGSISMSGYTGASGGVGGGGTPGVGGGGGGGAKGTSVPINTACNVSTLTGYSGASGGSGGSGGCGGKPGNAGGAGGSSIALVVVSAKSVKLDTVTLTPGQGGAGGVGGAGQLGGAQGTAGVLGGATNGGGLKVACAGGAGGTGGIGGPGGGGQGGHSLGLAFKGTAPTGMPTFPKTDPKPGLGGLAGTGAKDPNVGKGVAGNSTTPKSYTLEFP